MGFSLQAVEADAAGHEESLSLSRRAMAALRDVLISVSEDPDPSPVALFIFNDGQLVSPEDCRWIAERLRRVDRDEILRSDPAPEELLGLIDELVAFCEGCAPRGGFEVW